MTNLIEALFKSWEDELAQCEQQIKLMESKCAGTHEKRHDDITSQSVADARERSNKLRRLLEEYVWHSAETSLVPAPTAEKIPGGFAVRDTSRAKSPH